MSNSTKEGAAVAEKPRPDLRAVEAAGFAAQAADRSSPEHGPEAAAAQIAAPTAPQAGTPTGAPTGTPAGTRAEADTPAEIRDTAARDLAAARARRRQRQLRAAAAGTAAAIAAPAPAAPVPPLPAEAGAPAADGQPGLARLERRHWITILTFLALVLLPLAASVAYLWGRAADQYHSEVGFSIRTEESGAAAAGLLGALTHIGGGSASDADILFEYIRSQKIVEEVARDLDLRTIWNRPGTSWRSGDPIFTLGDNPSIEALHRQWQRMVQVAYDSNAGILHVRANAFDPEDARAIATAVLARSDALVNALSEQSRADAVRFAERELGEAESHLRAMREGLADFRRTHNLVDPRATAAGQSGLLNALQSELAQALVDRDVLTSYAAPGDQRVTQANRRIEAITARIEDERSQQQITGVSGSLPEVMGRYEELSVDLGFANTAYTQALGAVAASRAEASRQSRYLAAHIEPTLASTALYPRRLLLASLTGVFLFLGWSIAMLIYYNVRDNR